MTHELGACLISCDLVREEFVPVVDVLAGGDLGVAAGEDGVELLGAGKLATEPLA